MSSAIRPMEYDFDSSWYNGCHATFLAVWLAFFGLPSLAHSNFGGVDLTWNKRRSAQLHLHLIIAALAAEKVTAA